ncbi:MAG: protoheme IX farnesyltransferase [Chloroflexi bacterium]|nr:protoheme IX farnesyltransferase [Chloroflexota bacterium]
MTRFQKLVAATVATTFILVVIGVMVRSTDSGVACPTWPGCFPGQFLPGLDAGANVWFEWIHRTVAFVIGILVVGVAILAFADHRDRPSLLWPSIAAVGIALFQAWLGRETVRLGNSGPSVTAHLAAAMILFAVLIFALVRSFFPARIAGRGSSQRFALLAVFGAATTYALLLFGSNVTATDAALIFPDWPLMGGTFFPPLTSVTSAQVLHRWIAVVVGIVVLVVWLAARRTQREHRVLVLLAASAAGLFPIQAIIGGAQVLTRLAPWAQTLHLALGAAIWGLMAALAVAAYYTARMSPSPNASGAVDSGAGDGRGSEPAGVSATGPRSAADTVRAYIALTKPRIIELLLVTTVPAMILAAHGWPRLDLVWWTLVGGSLAAGSANAINCYLDRDIDGLMVRTRRRPLPAHQVEPDRAVVFGIVLGAIAFAELAWFVNLISAFLALLAIAFYVVVYTMILKRTTAQNIVIGGAAGALPPVIGWAAVTGNVGVPALLLFALVFYWTPPHFWALSLRIRKDYAAAGVPMLPVVRGVPETTRQIGLYTILLVTISLVLWSVARMGAIYLGSAVALGAIFLWQSYRLWRVGTSPEASTVGAIRLYKYSITYLSLLFLAIAVDALVVIPVG